MKRAVPVAVFVAAVASAIVHAQLLGPKLEARPSIAPAIPGVTAEGETVALIQDGLPGADGIVALRDGTPVFVEQNSPRIRRINPDDSISTLVEEAGTTRALGVDSKNRLIGLVLTSKARMADHVQFLYPPSSVGVIATDVAGKRFFQANDFVVTARDGIYMTDAGTLMKPALEEPTHVYYIPPGGTPRKVADKADRIVMPNGIGLSPDDRTLYVNDSRGDYMIAWDIQRDGSLKNRRDFAKYDISDEMRKTFQYQSDGMAVDQAGHIFAAMPLSVQVFSAKGQLLGKIPLTKKIQNLAFGGADRKSLYIVSQGSIWKVRTLTPGVKTRAK